MRHRSLAAVAATAAVAVAVAGSLAGAAQAKTRNCNFLLVNDTTAILSAKNMSCKAAQHALKRYKGHYPKHFTTPGGFKCKRTFQAGGGLVINWRCAKGRKSFRVGFGD
jgi:3-hydroxymyristoyl/3-hydroxydecanoyl-(acyl carrier protein) dehydratase